ncbi:unnamed protein product (macronuclear) [Paramecium tetraurelia]|uniref:C2 NT-type domain-containing protein n=1 Tax=Paramecium tetraurelia TaxID=5888 RepID=A0D9J7_PARTE|nr:uncharacterized protein GSPATT00014644001 [Paramecium tetraurelia]CAK79714.1 unnamed protein product [Paramecium tetraurelia]|eukprot:XP_001447111.1 hypothetical protein (macronuclear) [Paramecium tetraurelia strain d4-2]
MEDHLHLQVTIQEFQSDSIMSDLIAFQIKTKHTTITTNQYEICKGLIPINETHLISLENRSTNSYQNKLELLLLLNNEVAGRVDCNLTQLLDSNLELKNYGDFQVETEEKVMLNGNQVSNSRVKLTLKVFHQTEQHSQRTTINVATSESQREQDLVLFSLREELEQWKSKYTNIAKELNQLGDELLSLQIKEKGDLHSYLSPEINIFRKIIKSKLQYFLQIYDNQVDQTYLLKKELNYYRSKLCLKCSEPYFKHSFQSLAEKIKNLTSILDKKQTEQFQLIKSLEIEKQSQKQLQENVKILNQQQLLLRQTLAKSKKQVEDSLKLQTSQELQIQQLNKDVISKTLIILQLNKRCLELEQQNYRMNSDIEQIIFLYKQWSMSIVKSIEKESSEKQLLGDILKQLNNSLKFLASNDNLNKDSNSANEYHNKIEQYIQDYHLQVTQLESLLYQHRIKCHNDNLTLNSLRADEFNAFLLNFPLENVTEQSTKQYELSKQMNSQSELHIFNLIQLKDVEITKLKQKIADMLNIALELGNSVLVEQMQLTLM